LEKKKAVGEKSVSDSDEFSSVEGKDFLQT
jgi:hypothetical protein